MSDLWFSRSRWLGEGEKEWQQMRSRYCTSGWMPISCHFRDCKALLVTLYWPCTEGYASMSTSLWRTLNHLNHLIFTILINSRQTSGFSKVGAIIKYNIMHLTHVSGAITGAQTFTFTFTLPLIVTRCHSIIYLVLINQASSRPLPVARAATGLSDIKKTVSLILQVTT